MLNMKDTTIFQGRSAVFQR